MSEVEMGGGGGGRGGQVFLGVFISISFIY